VQTRQIVGTSEDDLAALVFDCVYQNPPGAAHRGILGAVRIKQVQHTEYRLVCSDLHRGHDIDGRRSSLECSAGSWDVPDRIGSPTAYALPQALKQQLAGIVNWHGASLPGSSGIRPSARSSVRATRGTSGCVSYPVGVDTVQVAEFIDRAAPGDVRETVAWLSANEYTLSAHRGEGAFGAQFVYTGEAEVTITVERSQWALDVARAPGAEAWQYDLLIAASRGLPYAEAFPRAADGSVSNPLPQQLPEGVSWATTLPGVLGWMTSGDREGAVHRAREERNRLMWPRK
jgi:hypothetical protein